MEVASARVRDYLAWEEVRTNLKEQENEGIVDVARMQTLTISIDKARGRIPDAVKQAYCTVVTVSEKNEVQAFKINVIDEPHFTIIKNDSRARIQDSSISAEALLPDGPYNLWRENETSRRVKDLSGAFAQLPHLPKMLRPQAITDTLVDGCQAGAFVLKLTRPDGSARTWWHASPDEAAMADTALELVLPEAAELEEIPHELLEPGCLPELWQKSGASGPLADSGTATETVTPPSITVRNVVDYFKGGNVIQIQRNGYQEPLAIPKAEAAVVNDAVAKAVEEGKLWLTNGPASVLGEPIPTGVLTEQAVLQRPPAMIAATEIMPEILPDAWTNDETTALAVATALSQKSGQTLPWKTIRDVINASLNARFIELDPTSGPWPCEYTSAQDVKLKVAASKSYGAGTDGFDDMEVNEENVKWAETELEPSEIQDLGDVVPQLLEIKSKSGCPITFRVQIAVGDAEHTANESTVNEINQILENLKADFSLQGPLGT